MPIAEELRVIIRAEADKAIRDMRAFDRSMDRTEKTGNRLGASMKTVGATMSRALTLPILAAGAASVKFASDIETQQTALKVLLGTAEAATDVYNEWQDFAASTPFQLEDIANTGKLLLAFGENAEDVTDTMRNLGDVAAGIGIPINELGEIYGKARVQGTLFAEDLNQLAGRGVPIFTELAEVMGVSASEIKKLASEGKVSFAELEQVFENLTDEGGMFEGMMEELSQTTAGKFSTALDNAKQAAAEFGAELLPLINDMLERVTLWAQRFGELDERTKRMILVIAGLAAAIGPAATAISGLSKAFSVLAAHPVVLALGAIAAAIGIVISKTVQANIENERANKRFRELQEEIRNTTLALRELTNEQEILIQERIRDEAAATLQSDSMEFLRTIYDQTGTASGRFADTLRTLQRAETELAELRGGDVKAAAEAELELLERLLDTTREVEISRRLAITARIESLHDLLRTQGVIADEDERTIARTRTLDSELALLQRRYEVFGDEIDLNGEKLSIYREAIVDLLDSGVDPLNLGLLELIETYNALREAVNSVDFTKPEVGKRGDVTFTGFKPGDKDAKEFAEDIAETTENAFQLETIFGNILPLMSLTADEAAEIRNSLIGVETVTFGGEIVDEVKELRETFAEFGEAWVDTVVRSEQFAENIANAATEMEMLSEIAADVGVSLATDIASGLNKAISGGDEFTFRDFRRSFTTALADAVAPGLGALAGQLFDLQVTLLDRVRERLFGYDPDASDRRREAREREREELLDGLRDTLNDEIEIRDEAMRELNRSFALEFDVLRDAWERNLIDTSSFVAQMEALGDEYDAERETIGSDVERIREILERLEGGALPGATQGRGDEISGAQFSSSGSEPQPAGVVEININGDVYGIDDLGVRVNDAIQHATQRGLIA